MVKPRPLHLVLFYPLFFVSGAAALVYQSLWLRLFTLVLGNSLHSAAVVLAAFMAGLALGAWGAGRLLRGRSDTLLLYACLELGIALAGLGAGWLIPHIGPLAAWLTGALPHSTLLASSVRFSVSFAVLLVPTALIGATLPVLIQHLTTRLEYAGQRIGALYGWNAAGAVIGCALTGFWLLRLAGTHASLLFAAALNLAVFGAALLLRGVGVSRNAAATVHETRAPRQAASSGRRLLVAAAAVTGAAALACEPVWARYLSYIVYNDMYVYYLMLSVILAGIGLGSLLYGAFLEKHLRSLSALGWLEAAFGLSIIACYLAAGWHYGSPESGLAIRHIQGLFEDRFLGLLAVRLFYGMLVMLPPSLLSGVIFPLTCRLYYRDEHAVGEDTGVIYAANTVGAVAGALLGGLLLIPALGVQWSLFLAAAALVGLGAWLLLAAPSGAAVWPRRSAVALMLLLLAAGALLPANQVRRFALKERAHHEVLFYREGLTGTVLVTRDKLNGLRNLFINAIAEVHDSFGGMQTFKLMGHLPFLLHRGEARSVLMVTYGAGIASGAVAVHPIQELHVVELEPAVVEASRQFSDRNLGVMDDPRVRIHLEDGRNFLYTTDRRFDIIISDATNPGSADSWLLYTVEFYRLCLSRLNTGGVMAQWLPLHTGTPEGYKAILAAFQAVFPHTSIWFTKDYTLLIGLPEKLEVSWPRLKAALTEPSLQKDLSPWCLDNPIELAECFLMGEDAVREMIAGTRPNTDNRPFYQLTAGGEQPGAESIINLLDSHRERENVFLRQVSPAEATALSDSLEARFTAEHFILLRDYPAADKVLPGRCNVSHYLSEYELEPDYLAAVADSNPACYYVQRRSASGLAARGEYARSARIFRRMAALDPSDPVLYYNLGNLLLENGQADSAAVAYREAVALGRRDTDILGRLGKALLRADKADQALPCLSEAVELDSSNTEALFHLGYALNRNGRQEEAIACYERLVTRYPDYLNALINLGFLYLGRRTDSRAETVLSHAAELEPGNFQSWYGLGMARLRLGKKAEAAPAFREALKLRPGDTEIKGILEKLK